MIDIFMFELSLNCAGFWSIEVLCYGLKGHLFILYFMLFILQNVVRKVEDVDVDQSKPKKDCVIEDSGTIPVEEPFNVEKDAAEE